MIQRVSVMTLATKNEYRANIPTIGNVKINGKFELEHFGKLLKQLAT